MLKHDGQRLSEEPGGVSGAAKGALIGSGAGAYANADKGDKAKKNAKHGAAISAGVGLVTDGVSGAAKGAWKRGMAVFTLIKGGLMYEASIGGQKYNFKPLMD
jgi:hypothetical protein